jgi:hypothetical protein
MADGNADGNQDASLKMTPSNDLSQRISMGAWHPKENIFTVAKHNSLFIYTEKRSIGSSNDKKVPRDRGAEKEMMQ